MTKDKKDVADKTGDAAEAVGVAAQAVTAAAAKDRASDRWQTVFLPVALAGITAASGYFSYRASIEAAHSRSESKGNGEKLVEVKDALDGRLTELLELTRKNSRAEGLLEGKSNKGTVTP